MKILIETYRGFKIIFDTDSEKFESDVSEGNAKESKSFSAVKKYIDEFIKSNYSFTPFWIETNPKILYIGGYKSVKVVGIRKDGRFVIEENGDLQQLSDYNLEKYILKVDENEAAYTALNESYARQAKVTEAFNIERRNIIAGMNLIPLKGYKADMKAKEIDEV